MDSLATYELAAAEALEPGASLVVELVGETAGRPGSGGSAGRRSRKKVCDKRFSATGGAVPSRVTSEDPSEHTLAGSDARRRGVEDSASASGANRIDSAADLVVVADAVEHDHAADAAVATKSQSVSRASRRSSEKAPACRRL